MTDGRILIVSPMPLSPASAGNRRRALDLARFLKLEGFTVHAAVSDHEDQVYHAFGQEPPCDLRPMMTSFDDVFYINSRCAPRIRTAADAFFIDDWYPAALDAFAERYLAAYGPPQAVLVNYVFYSRILERFPAETLKIIDAHDRFADRQKANRIGRSPPNFFYTTQAEEGKGLDRADLVLAIQSLEAQTMRAYTRANVTVLGHHSEETATSRAPLCLKRFGFLGHGNDANVASISRFAHDWAAHYEGRGPTLVIGGEVSGIFAHQPLPGVEVLGYVEDVSTFYDGVDAIVAPILFGTGLKIKVVEALARGKIVVGTPAAFEGLPVDEAAASDGDDAIASMFAAISRLKDDKKAIAEAAAQAKDLYARYRASIVEQKRALVAALRAVPAKRGRHAAAETGAPTATRLDHGGIVVEYGPLVTGRRADRSRPPGALLAVEITDATHEPNSETYGPRRTLVYAAETASAAAAPRDAAVARERMLSFVAEKRFLTYLTRASWDRLRSNAFGLEFMSRILPASSACWSDGIVQNDRDDLSIIARVPAEMLYARPDHDLVLFEYFAREEPTVLRRSAADVLECKPVSDSYAFARRALKMRHHDAACAPSIVPAIVRVKAGGERLGPTDIGNWRLTCVAGPVVCCMSSAEWDGAPLAAAAEGSR